jgi:hypothetical protein
MNRNGKSDWRPIRGECPCCGHGGGYCTALADRTIFLCRRNSSGKPIRQKDGSTAWLFRASELASAGKPVSVEPRRHKAKLTATEIKAALKSFRGAVNPERLTRFAASLGLSEKSLRDFGIGWDSDRGVWSFPMFDGQRRPVGIHYRAEDGRKFCAPGSQLGLFVAESYAPTAIPDAICDNPHPLVLILPEGLTDACAASDLGYAAIGRPSNAAAPQHVVDLLTSFPKQEVVVFADNDETKFRNDGFPFWPGIEGALALAEKCLPHAGILRFLIAPKEFKDLRGMLRSHISAATFTAQVMAASRVSKSWLDAAYRRLEEKRTQERKPPCPDSSTTRQTLAPKC